MSDFKLYKGDCLELMKEIPDGSVDMVLCDPPYGCTENDWDKPLDFGKMWEQYRRITKKNAAIVLFSQMPFTVDLVNSNRKMFRYNWIYQKTRCAGFLDARRKPLKTHEIICLFANTPPKYNPQMWQGKPYKTNGGSTKCGKGYNAFKNEGMVKTSRDCSDGMRFPIDVVKFSNSNLQGHPTQKPVALLEYLIRTYTDAGERVLDNTMGSGSTGVACMNTGRDFIGIEMDETYFATAERRISEAKDKADMALFPQG